MPKTLSRKSASWSQCRSLALLCVQLMWCALSKADTPATDHEEPLFGIERGPDVFKFLCGSLARDFFWLDEGEHDIRGFETGLIFAETESRGTIALYEELRPNSLCPTGTEETVEDKYTYEVSRDGVHVRNIWQAVEGSEVLLKKTQVVTNIGTEDLHLRIATQWESYGGPRDSDSRTITIRNGADVPALYFQSHVRTGSSLLSRFEGTGIASLDITENAPYDVVRLEIQGRQITTWAFNFGSLAPGESANLTIYAGILSSESAAETLAAEEAWPVASWHSWSNADTFLYALGGATEPRTQGVAETRVGADGSLCEEHTIWRGCQASHCCARGLECAQQNFYYAQCLPRDYCRSAGYDSQWDWSCAVLTP